MKTLMLVCGEPSGDQLGAQLMAAIKQLAGDRVRIVGVGGPAMTREGLTSLYSLDATAVMGLREVVPAIPAKGSVGASEAPSERRSAVANRCMPVISSAGDDRKVLDLGAARSGVV